MQDISTKINRCLPFEAYFALAKIGAIQEQMMDMLSEVEQEEYQDLTNERRQQEYVTARLTLKKLARSFNLENISIHKDDFGQPYGYDNGNKYFVSIAHSDEEVFCGFSKAEAIGVDLEPVNRHVPQKLIDRMMHSGEESLFSEVALIRLWTIKEAYIKLLGKGLRINMNEVKLSVDGDQFTAEINNDKTAKICSFQLEQNWLAVAYYQ